MVDLLWAMRYASYGDDELKEVIRGSVPGEESPAVLAAIEELAKRVVAKDAAGRA